MQPALQNWAFLTRVTGRLKDVLSLKVNMVTYVRKGFCNGEDITV